VASSQRDAIPSAGPIAALEAIRDDARPDGEKLALEQYP
jgi:hypothetical protein